jgi:hypothetical protein
MIKPILVLAVACASLTFGCSEYQQVASNVCGNLVTDPGEQCDGQSDCIAQGSNACRFSCENAAKQCPGTLGCSIDGVCIEPAGKFVSYEAATRYEMPADRIVVGDLDGDRRDDVIGVGESIRVRFGAPSNPLSQSYEKQIRPPTGAAAIAQLDGKGGLDVVFPTADGVFTLVSRGRELESIPYASANALPSDASRSCSVSNGWAMCRAVDLNRDNIVDRVGFFADRDNVEIELGRSTGAALTVVIDTVDIITDITVGDFDGDGFGDIGFATRSSASGADQHVSVVYGAPQPDAFVTKLLATADSVSGIAAADISQPPDGVDDLAVERTVLNTTGVAVYLGDSARDLSAPFALKAPQGLRTGLDTPYALVAGEFVGGANSGVDVMAYARNSAQPDQSFFWWLRGLGGAQLTVGATDTVEKSNISFLDETWQVGDLVTDSSAMANGPDEVIGLSPTTTGCGGPALTVAVPSARFTPTDLLRKTCLQVDGSGWRPAAIGLLRGNAPRAVSVALRGVSWWVGQASRLDEATMTKRLDGATTALPSGCRTPRLWQQTPDAATSLSWSCDGATETRIVAAQFAPKGSTLTAPAQTIATVPLGSDHVTGDFNGDGLTDIAIRNGRELTVLLQCSTDMVGSTPGC